MGSKLTGAWKVLWCLAPAVMATIGLWTLSTTRLSGLDRIDDTWMYCLGWIIVLSCLVLIIVIAFYEVYIQVDYNLMQVWIVGIWRKRGSNYRVFPEILERSQSQSKMGARWSDATSWLDSVAFKNGTGGSWFHITPSWNSWLYPFGETPQKRSDAGRNTLCLDHERKRSDDASSFLYVFFKERPEWKQRQLK